MTVPPRPEVFSMTKAPAPRTTEGVAIIAWAKRQYQSIQRSLAGTQANQFDFALFVQNENSNLGDGRDATAAILNLVAVAQAERRGPIFYPIGDYPVTQEIVNPVAVMHAGFVNPAGGVGGQSNMSPTLYHDFDGDFFSWVGSSDVTAMNQGGGMRDLRIVQLYGDSSMTDGVGSALAIHPTDINHRNEWLKFENLVIEEAGNAPWTWWGDIDNLGIVGAASDIFFTRIDTHTSASTGACGALRLNGSNGIYINGLTCSINGDIVVGDTDQSNGVQIVDGNFRNLVMDRAIQFEMLGGTVTNITTTANTTGTFRINRLAGTITDLSNGGCWFEWYDGTVLNTNRPVKIMGSVTLWSGSGVPSNAFGVDGDWYGRFDTPGSALQRLYVKIAGSWTGIL